MEKIKTYIKPLTNDERDQARKEHGGNCFLSMSSRFHLIDSLKDLKFGKPVKYQSLVDELIELVKTREEEGVPFT